MGAIVTTEHTKVVNGAGQQMTLVRCQKTHHCRCGQELDDHSREHCPRCGTTLRD